MIKAITPEEFAEKIEDLAGVDIEALMHQPRFDASRRKAFNAARHLFYDLETPNELARRLGWGDATVPAVLKIALDQGLLTELKFHNEMCGMTTLKLADATEQPHELVKRVMRHLAANRLVKQTSPNTYAASAKTKALLEPTIRSGVVMHEPIFMKPLANLPRFIAMGGYEERAQPGRTNFEQVNGAPFFPWLEEHPAALNSFMTYLKGYREGRPSWIDTYPAEERLLKGAKETGPLLVDIGAGVGQATQDFFDRFPQPPGRVIVQDRRHVLLGADLQPAIERQPHDFLKPQPVIGARAYLMQFVLHDWVDEECLKILTQLKGAMIKDYSKLLICEHVVPEIYPDPLSTGLDWAVESVLGATERTREDWSNLFDKAGMKIEAVYTVSGASDSVIEVVLA